MIEDILTVMWKESKSIFRYQGSRARFLLVLMTPVLLAVVLPWQWGAEWVQQVPSVILSILIPVVIVGVTVPDSFAGERERHTLGTLLASRLPDRAILIGKLTVSIVFAWVVTVVVLLASLITVNIAHGDGALILYTPVVAFADLSLSFLAAVLFAATGVLISMRAKTVQQAAQVLMSILLVPAMLLQLVLFVFLTQFRDLIDRIVSQDGRQLLAVVLAVLVVLAAGMLIAAVAKFRRSRLVLS
jgi:ABC-2 type transport system permease protein